MSSAVAVVGMWVVMMMAMMLPSLVPMLWRYRRAVGGAGGDRHGRLTAVVGLAYFVVWTLLGMAAFPLGVALAGVAVAITVERLAPTGERVARVPLEP